MSLKQFQILSKLGSGSFGVVHKVRRRQGGQLCVIKQVEMRKMDRKMREWTLNEAKIMRNISSPYIVKYLQSFTEKDNFYICMEYCSGGDLSQALKAQMGKPLSEETVWKFTLQIMLGLRDLHAKKILHRDIKTMNVFLTEGKAVRIGDLGAARTLTGDFANTVVGTPYYLSPEMCEEKPYNEKTDVWAMGCLVYELCTFKHPFEASSQAALALKIIVGKYAPIPAHYSQALAWLIRLCLSVDYKRRPTINYLLAQQSIVDIAKKYGISLDGSREGAEEKPEPPPTKQKPKGVVERRQQLQGKIVVQKQGMLKSDAGKKVQTAQKSAEKRKEKSLEKPNPKAVVQKDQKPPQFKLGLPPKDKLPQAAKKVEERAKQVKAVVKELVKEERRQEGGLCRGQGPLLLQSKPKKSVQQVVDDEQLFLDFGITPEKIARMEEKVEFKKVSPINWNMAREEKGSSFVELPTIRTPSSCDIVAVECKEVEEEVAEEMDDNLPYRSEDEDTPSEDEALLVEEVPLVEEEGELRRKERALLLERKIAENQRRRRELVELRQHYESEILLKTSRAQYERIKWLMREDGEEDVERLISKELQGASIVKFIKIYHYEIQIERCDQNIAHCQQQLAP